MKALNAAIIALMLLANACKETVYVYELERVTVTNQSIPKNNVKSASAFISIAYSDLMGATISPSELKRLTKIFGGIGDKRLVEDMLIRHFLNYPDSLERVEWPIPTDKILLGNDPFQNPIESLFIVERVMLIKEIRNQKQGRENFRNWQKSLAPHSPGGINQPGIPFFDIAEKTEWYRNSCKKWAESYPEEVENAKKAVAGIFEEWKKIRGDGYTGLRQQLMDEEDKIESDDRLPIALPTSSKEMRADVTGFIRKIFENFYNREPSADEIWYLRKFIESNPEIQPKMIFYSIMKSEEYRYF